MTLGKDYKGKPIEWIKLDDGKYMAEEIQTYYLVGIEDYDIALGDWVDNFLYSLDLKESENYGVLIGMGDSTWKDHIRGIGVNEALIDLSDELACAKGYDGKVDVPYHIGSNAEEEITEFVYTLDSGEAVIDCKKDALIKGRLMGIRPIIEL